MGELILSRRSLIAAGAILGTSFALGGCTSQGPEPGSEPPSGPVDSATTLPAASPNPDSPFQVDENVNMDTIDGFLHLAGVAYRDMRMVADPANYAAIGGSPNLDIVLPGFRVVPFPYIATLPNLPVDGAYAGPHLFDVAWNGDGTVGSATPCYAESEGIIDDLFPKDETIVLMCGGGGYAGQMRQLLIYLGYSPDALYNAGGAWEYTGYESIQVTDYNTDGSPNFHPWRADIAQWDFDQLSPL